MKKNFIFFALFCAFSVNLFAQSSITKSDYEIYGEVLRDIRRTDIENAKKKYSFVILSDTETESFSDGDYKEKKYRGLDRDFKRRNRTPLTFRKIFPVKYKYELVNKPDFEKLLDEGRKETERVEEEQKKENISRVARWSADWKYFYKKYPTANGYYRFSAIGYSRNKRFAVIKIKGEGDSWKSYNEYLFEKIKNKWVIVESGGGFIVGELNSYEYFRRNRQRDKR